MDFCRCGRLRCQWNQSHTVDFVDFQQSRPCWIQLCRRCVPGFRKHAIEILRGVVVADVSQDAQRYLEACYLFADWLNIRSPCILTRSTNTIWRVPSAYSVRVRRFAAASGSNHDSCSISSRLRHRDVTICRSAFNVVNIAVNWLDLTQCARTTSVKWRVRDFFVIASFTLGHFTFWFSLSLSPKFGLRPKISQTVKSFFFVWTQRISWAFCWDQTLDWAIAEFKAN